MLNKVTLIGHLGGEPECRALPTGGAVTNITLATSESWTDKQSGQKQERTEWHRVVFFNRLAEIAGQYLHKGGQVYIEGSLRTRKWQDQSGQDRYTTEIVASEMKMLGKPQQGQQTQQQAPQQQPQQAQRPQQPPQGQPQGQQSQQPPQANPFDQYDECPF